MGQIMLILGQSESRLFYMVSAATMQLVILILSLLVSTRALIARVSWKRCHRFNAVDCASFKSRSKALHQSSVDVDDVDHITLPEDARNIPFVGDWNYWYREKGMQTSSDDVLVAFVASLWYFELSSSSWQGSNLVMNDNDRSGVLRTDIEWIECLKYLFENIEERLPQVTSIDRNIGESHFIKDDDDTRKAQVNVYVDLGCGVGSSLLLVSHTLRPAVSLGVEVQTQSAALASLSARAISRTADATSPTRIAVIHADIRQLCSDRTQNSPESITDSVNEDLLSRVVSDSDTVSYDHLVESFKGLALSDGLCGRCDLLTANSPYLPLTDTTRSVPVDSQRRSARFEFHGGVEEYMRVARRLLSSARTGAGVGAGRLVLSFWAKDAARVHAAAMAAGLRVRVRIDVLGGPLPYENDGTNTSQATSTTNNSGSLPYLSVFEVCLHAAANSDSEKDEISAITSEADTVVLALDLRFRPGKEATCADYKAIQRWLKMRPRPLKQRKTSTL